MAYQTGSAASHTDLMAAVLSFAQARGWTLTGGSTWPISKGNCFVNWWNYDATWYDWTTGSSVPVNQREIHFTLGTALSPVGANPWNMPGSIVNNVTLDWSPRSWGHIGGYVAYHLFSGDEVGGDPAYVHCVVQVTAEFFTHFSFGNLDKRGLTHNNVGYVTATQNTSLGAQTTTDASNEPAAWAWPFGGLAGTRNGWNRNTTQINPGNALPVQFSAGIRGSLDLWDTITPAHTGQNAFSYLQSNPAGLLNPVWHARTMPFSGVVPMYPVPCFVWSGSVLTYLGEYPNVRYCRIDSLEPGDELTYAGETWKFFPLTRKTSLASINLARAYTSGPMGIAYKKVV